MTRGLDLLLVSLASRLSPALRPRAFFRGVEASSAAQSLTGPRIGAFTLYGVVMPSERPGPVARSPGAAGFAAAPPWPSGCCPSSGSPSRCPRTTLGRRTSTRACRRPPCSTFGRPRASATVLSGSAEVFHGPARQVPDGDRRYRDRVHDARQRRRAGAARYRSWPIRIAHGLPTIALSPGRDALAAVIVYFFAYLVTNAGAFAAVSALYRDETKAHPVAMLAGDGRRTPFAAGVLALCLFSLAGIPATAGFIGKFFLFKAALQSGLSPWPHRDANSLVSVGYYLKVVTFLHALTRSMTSSPALRPRIAFALALCAIGIRDRHLPRHPVAVAAMPPRLASGPTSSVPASGRLARQAR